MKADGCVMGLTLTQQTKVDAHTYSADESGRWMLTQWTKMDALHLMLTQQMKVDAFNLMLTQCRWLSRCSALCPWLSQQQFFRDASLPNLGEKHSEKKRF